MDVQGGETEAGSEEVNATLSDRQLPAGWAISELKDLIGRNGCMTDGDWIESKDQDPGGEIRLIQLADIGENRFLDKSKRFLTKQTAERLKCFYLHADDILISRLGDPLGKACIFPVMKQECITAVDVHVVRRGEPEIDVRWLCYFLNSPAVRYMIEAQANRRSL